MAQLEPTPLAQYGGYVYTLGNIWLHQRQGRPRYFDSLDEAVAHALEGWRREMQTYRRDCPAKRSAARAIAALSRKGEP